jgi:hypothetical protein
MDLKEIIFSLSLSLCLGVNWILLAQNMVKWRAQVNLIMSYFRFSQ